MLQGLQKVLPGLLCLVRLFFLKVSALRMIFAHSVWAVASPWMLEALLRLTTGDDWQRFLWIWGSGSHLCLQTVQAETNIRTLPSPLRTHIFRFNHFFSHLNSCSRQHWRDRICSNNQICFPSFLSNSHSFVIQPITEQILHPHRLLVSQQTNSALIKWALLLIRAFQHGVGGRQLRYTNLRFLHFQFIFALQTKFFEPALLLVMFVFP